jgi:hypothetical protein
MPAAPTSSGLTAVLDFMWGGYEDGDDIGITSPGGRVERLFQSGCYPFVIGFEPPWSP